jgi:hypothetical protein
MYTQCDTCEAVETTLASINTRCFYCNKGTMREVVNPL